MPPGPQAIRGSGTQLGPTIFSMSKVFADAQRGKSVDRNRQAPVILPRRRWTTFALDAVGGTQGEGDDGAFTDGFLWHVGPAGVLGICSMELRNGDFHNVSPKCCTAYGMIC